MKKLLFVLSLLSFVACTGGAPLAVNSQNADRVIIEGKTIKADIARNFGVPSKNLKVQKD